MQLQQGLEQANIGQMKRGKLGKMARREEREFYLFISLWIVGFILFDAGPIIASLVISFTDWPLTSSPHWIGIANYTKMLRDDLFYIALKNSIYFGIGS